MVLEDLGQSFWHGAKMFTVGGIALNKKSDCGQCGIIEKICTDKTPCPTAICQFGSRSVLELPLDQLEPMNPEMPHENGQMYVLYHTCSDEIGVLTQIMGISSDKSALLLLMLEDMREKKRKDSQFELTSAHINENDDLICFYYEQEDLWNAIYLSYIIVPAPVYSKAEGGAAV